MRPHRGSLPVVTAEIGDTWIHGVGSDPVKTAGLRALLRWRTGAGIVNDPGHAAFHENLLLTTEHTWGRDTKSAFGLLSKYDGAFSTTEFKRNRSLPRYRLLEKSWTEQRGYLKAAVAALPSETERRQARATLRELKPRAFKPGIVCDPGERFTTRHFEAAFDPATGGIRSLRPVVGKWNLASRVRPLGVLHYEIFSGADYAWLWKHYNVNHASTAEWAQPDFLKPGLASTVTQSRRWPARLRSLSQLKATDGQQFLAEGDFALTGAERRQFGAPGRWQIRYTFPDDRPAVEMIVQWFDKQAVRLPEALWFALAPVTGGVAAGAWRLSKLGSSIDPCDVVRHGNRRLHAAENTRCENSEYSLAIEHPDAPLVAPGGPSLVRYRASAPNPARGPWFNLYNNTWGTNFPMWCEDDARFRFRLNFTPSV